MFPREEFSVNQSDSIISKIELDNSSYSGKIFIYIYIKPESKKVDFDRLKSEIISIDNDADIMGKVLIAVNADKARSGIDKLFEMQQMSAADRSEIENYLRK